MNFYKAPILVWQMGKVGSMALHIALTEAGLPAVHIHRLNPRLVAESKRLREEAGLEPSWQDLDADRLAPLLTDPAIGFRVVSAVRDPVALALSALFQQWDDAPPDFGFDSSDPHQIARWFSETYDYRHMVTWFEDEIEAVLGVSIYDAPFDRASKSLRLDHGRLRLLVVRKEDDNHIKERALRRFVGRNDIKLGNINDAASKPQGALYAQVKQIIKLPRDLVEQYLSARWVRHFYSIDEIVAMRDKWSQGSTDKLNAWN